MENPINRLETIPWARKIDRDVAKMRAKAAFAGNDGRYPYQESRMSHVANVHSSALMVLL